MLAHGLVVNKRDMNCKGLLSQQLFDCKRLEYSESAEIHCLHSHVYLLQIWVLLVASSAWDIIRVHL